MDYTKDIVFIVGQNAVGKTTALRYLTWVAEQRGVACEPEPISDYLFILKQTLMDDAQGGFRHYHSWSERKIGGHDHANGEATIPFAITDNGLVENMQEDFLKAITVLPRLEKLRFVEWTGGINTNPPEEPVSQVDFSFSRIAKKLKEDLLPVQWVERVRAVIHISAETKMRIFFNTKDSDDESPQVLSGHASARRMSTVLNLFGHDDFCKIRPFFEKAGVQFIFDVCNRGNGKFYEALGRISDIIL